MKQTFSTHMVPSTAVLFHRDTTYLTKDGWRRGANESLYHVGYYQPQGGRTAHVIQPFPRTNISSCTSHQVYIVLANYRIEGSDNHQLFPLTYTSSISILTRKRLRKRFRNR